MVGARLRKVPVSDDARSVVEGMPRLSPDAAREILKETDARAGVKVEAAHKTVIGLASLIYALDGSTTSTYLVWSTSTFGGQALLGSIQVAQSMVIAIGKPVIAKVADVTSRGMSFVVLFLRCGKFGTVASGIIIYAVGLQLLTQVIIADVTTFRWRGIVSAMVSVPLIVTGFISTNISAAIIKRSGWHWG
ncbi:hypothetical protein EW146_g10314, partial [Bondarzewia mesenterica]